ncbi:hypothetical protein [Phytohabitans kaempferiae]|uniref:DUF222 domain-containing protein n=1 Tax=Phytohabitans kaempferiae TaxID=1620943 RepID=A0ABV6M512_9ACTN
MRSADAEGLRGLGEKSQSEIRRWLRENQPGPGNGRAFWWEGLATRALHEVYRAEDDQARRAYASVVKAVTDEAVDLAVTSPLDGAIRVANLAAFLGERGRGLFDADEIVKACLAHIELPFDVALKQAHDWRTLPRPQILALRRAKNLVSACAPLGDRLTDPVLAAELARWTAQRDRLP